MLNANLMRSLSCLAVLMLLVFAATTRAENKLLNLPADISHRAIHSVMLGVDRASTRLVTVGERGFILISDDEGHSWKQVSVPVSVTLTAVDFVSAEKGWVVGHGGVVLRTDDGGNTWIKVFDGIQAAQLELAAAKASLNPDNRRSKFRLREAQFSVEGGADKPFLNVDFSDENNGIVVGAYGLAFATADGGETWQSIMGQVPNTMGMHLYSIFQADNRFLIGEQGSLFRSLNDEPAYARIETPYEGSFFGMVGTADNGLLLYGLRGHVFRSQDGGDSWTPVVLPLPVTLTSGILLKDGGLVLVDETGQLLLSRDHGVTFSTVEIENPAAFTDLIETPSGDLVLSGVRGITRVPVAKLKEKVAGHE